MKDDKETRERLLISAKQEFLKNGYMRASLRNICRNAGVTTGALYFFFEGKEDLFASLVKEPLDKLLDIMNRHYQGEIGHGMKVLGSIEDFREDFQAAGHIIDFMYQYYDEFQLLIAKSQGSRFEDCVDWFVEISERHYRGIADEIADKMQIDRLDGYFIHWLSHMQIDMFIYLLTHERSVENAHRYLEPIMKYVISGWKGLFAGKQPKDI